MEEVFDKPLMATSTLSHRYFYKVLSTSHLSNSRFDQSQHHTRQDHQRMEAMKPTGAGGASSGEIKVLGTWASPFVLRVRVALHLKGLDYECVEENLAEKSELLLASNPVHKKVPVLLHAGKPVYESMLIVEYLDDAFPGAGRAFLPADPHARAVARFWAAYVDDQLLHSWLEIHATTEEEKADAVARTLAAVDALEGALAEVEKSGGNGWFGGDGVGLVDIALGGFVPIFQASEASTGLRVVDPARNPRLAVWVERFCLLDAARAAMPAVDRLVNMGKRRL